MVRQLSSLLVCLAAGMALAVLLAGCGGNAAPAVGTVTLPLATNTAPAPTVAAVTATTAPTEAEPTATVEVSTPTTEATATPEAPTETPEALQETPVPSSEPAEEGLPTPSVPPAEAKQMIEARAEEAVEALKNKDMEKLATLVHPDKGVGFAPYTFIDETNLRLTREQLASAFSEQTVRHWGVFDGSGDPIDLTFGAYYDRFIYNHDFAAAPNISYNEFKGHGNMFNNVFEVYPNGIAVEYHFPGFDPQFEGMDWNALYLVFEKHTDGNWYLVHIAHGQWTI